MFKIGSLLPINFKQNKGDLEGFPEFRNVISMLLPRSKREYSGAPQKPKITGLSSEAMKHTRTFNHMNGSAVA